MPVNDPSKYPLRVNTAPKKRARFQVGATAALVVVIAATGVFLLPQIIAYGVQQEQTHPSAVTTVATAAPFPVSVDPATKSIVSNPQADQLYANETGSSLTAAVGDAMNIISWIAALIDNTSLYQSLAAADGHLIVIEPGYRREQVLNELTSALGWNKTQQQQFTETVAQEDPGLTDGMFAPGNYVVNDTMTPSNVAALLNVKFEQTILLHYGTSTAAYVPLPEALTVASLIEREASGPSDMRIISGIIWNRLFNNMNLQIDATLQYAMGENKSGNWWQAVVPKDKYISSSYNTYAHAGLPPGPIASPSLAAVIAALNPVQTSCLYYFHDSKGIFHCSDSYTQHVALLKKYYGQGK
ncbi:MAG: endolytic transglycosylase MltG [Candidatus Pacebacteria bacterium]|nr:endolytic transglycosylase MltG [Candidatus Paceibacterota bacterium]